MDDPIKRMGIQCRPGCHTGMAELATSTPVYPAKAAPNVPEKYPATWPIAPGNPRRPMRRPVAIAEGAAALRIQAPRFIGDVGRKTRSMFMNRDGRPKS